MHMWHNKAAALRESDETYGVDGDQGNGEEKQTSQVRDAQREMTHKAGREKQ